MTVELTIDALVQAIRIVVQIPAGHDHISIQRVGPSGTTAYVRGYQQAEITPGQQLVVRDYEAPLGVPLEYTVTTWAASAPDVTDTGTAMITIPDGGCEDTWLTDLARPTNTQKIVIEALDELNYAVPVGVHEIIGRRTPIVSSDVADTPTFELAFLTETDGRREDARATLGNGVPVLLRTPPQNGIGSLYFAVTGFREQRIVKRARQPDRRFAVSCVQVERPDTSLYLPLAPTDYQEVAARFATYADLNTQRSSYDAVLYDWSGDTPSDIVPWPPEDI